MNFTHISTDWNVLEQFKTQYLKHYANDADELERYGFFKKSKANVVKLNALNHEPVFGFTSISNSMMIKGKNIIMKERIWTSGVINETTFETHCEGTRHFPPVRQSRNVDDCRVHKCGPIQGVQDSTCECPRRAFHCSSRGTQFARCVLPERCPG